MSENSGQGDRIDVEIRGSVAGQVAAGRGIKQQYVRNQGPAAVTEADLTELTRLVGEVKAKVAAETPPEQREAALGRIDELHEAVAAKEPDLTTMQYVRSWFAKNLPKLVGTVTGLIVHPLVGRIVEAAGDLAAAEFRERLGGESAK